MTTMTTPAEQAEAIREGFDARVWGIRGDQNISDTGKIIQIASLYETEQAKLTALQSTKDTATASMKTRMQTQLFGLPSWASASDVMSLRDANDRVSTIDDPRDAAELLESARINGDITLAKAILQRAFKERMSWDPLIQTYGDNNPALVGSIQTLLTIINEEAHTTSYRGWMDEASLYTLHEPNEVKQAQRLNQATPTWNMR